MYEELLATFQDASAQALDKQLNAGQAWHEQRPFQSVYRKGAASAQQERDQAFAALVEYERTHGVGIGPLPENPSLAELAAYNRHHH